MYSQTSHKQTLLGPSIAVHLREVSAYRRLKNTNTIGGRVWQSCHIITECGCVGVNTNTIGGRVWQSCLLITECVCMLKILVNAQQCNYAKIVPKESHFESSW